MTVPYPRAVREHALALAHAEGLTAAADQTGIKRDTIKNWIRRGVAAGEVSQPAPPRRDGVELSDLERLGRSLRSTQDEYDRLIHRGEHTSAAKLAVPIGVLTDKIALLRREPGRHSGESPGSSDRKRVLIARVERMLRMDVRHKFETMTLGEIDRLIGELKLERKARQEGAPSTFVNPDDDEDVISEIWAIDLAERKRADPFALGRARPMSPARAREAQAVTAQHEGVTPAEVKREPAPVAVVREIELVPLDDEDEDPEPIVEPEVARLPLMRRPRVGAERFPLGSVQRKIGGFPNG